MESAMAVVEMARVDASVATFNLVHTFLAMVTIDLLVRPLAWLVRHHAADCAAGGDSGVR
jgi:hypothetical protein